MTNASANSQTEEPTVFIVDDDEQLRTALRLLLRSVQIRAVTFASAAEFLEVFQPNQSGCIVADVRMPGISGLELQQELHAAGHQIPVIILTGHAEVEMAVEAVKAGAMDFVEKPYSAQKMIELIQRAIVTDASNRQHQAELSDFQTRRHSLSEREQQVLELLVDGKTTKEIALALDIRPPTADFHRRNLLEKMNVENAVQLARIYEAQKRTNP